MITKSFLYTKGDDLEKIISEFGLNLGENCIINIFTPVLTREEAVLVSKDIKKLLPYGEIFGASACSVIYNGEQYGDETLIYIEKYEKTKINSKLINIKDKDYTNVCDTVIDTFENKEPKILKIMFGNYYGDAHQFIEEFNDRKLSTKMIGGIAGEIAGDDITPYVFNENEAIADGVILANMYNEELNTYIGVNITHEPISETFTLTKKTGMYWDTIDDTPAVDWLNEYLGLKDMKQYKSWEELVANSPLARFEMVLEGHNGASRFLHFDAEKNRIAQYFTQVPTGTKFKIGYTSPQKCVEQSYRICTEIMTEPVESIFCYSCLLRRLYLQNCAKWELTPFKDYNICGIFTLGEIAFINNKHEFFNGTSVIVGQAERENYIVPRTDVFGDLYEIEDDTKELVNFVIRKYSEAISGKNKDLLNVLVEQQRILEIKMKFDQKLGLDNLNKYREDEVLKKFNKLCFLQIENADLLIGYFGQDKYTDYLRKAIKYMEKYIKKKQYDKYLHTYMINNTTLAMAAGSSVEDNYFIDMMNKLYKNFQYIKLEESSVPIMTRFVVVVNQKNLIESAFNVLQANKNNQSHFIVCDKDTKLEYSTKEELKMISILNRVIERKGITPYYQGVYDNYKDKITKYEALMRLVDDDGKVYPPARFMDIAKKYHMYAMLSRAMIEKVIEESGDMQVSINLSAHDIISDEFKTNFFKQIKNIKNPENYTIEILEDEKFDNVDILVDFIEEVRKYGIKVAIDDFGSGYSNLSEIANINPDFIKIDSSIIKNITHSKKSRTVLKTIVYLAKELEIDLIAEFVENEEIQNYMKELNIRYSQGYYFSMPRPLKEREI